MKPSTFEEFSAAARARGYDEILVREWKPAQVMELHKHPFDTSALVIQGEFWLTVNGETRHIKVGDTFEVPRDLEHEEKYGPEGATFWAARMN